MRLCRGALIAFVLAMPRPSLGQGLPALPSFGPDPQPRILFDVNIFNTASSPAHQRDYTTSFITFGETATTRATYASPQRVNSVPLDFGATYMIARWFGAGFGYSRTTYEMTPSLAATIPHPVFLRSQATATGTTGHLLSRHENENRLFVTLAPYRSNRFEVHLFGGPSFFSYSAQMVQTVSYAQTYDATKPQSTVTITGSTDGTVNGDTIGFSGGADFAYFLTKCCGVTGGFRISRGIVPIDEPLSGLSQDVLVGSNVGFVGLRFRFGR